MMMGTTNLADTVAYPDPALPHLRRALHTGFMKEIFGRELRVHGTRFGVIGCARLHALHRVGRNCLIGYRVDVQDRETGRRESLLFSATVFRKDEGLMRAEGARSWALAVPRFGRPFFFVPELEMVVLAFPNDRKIRCLPSLVNLERLSGSLLRALPGNWIGPALQIDKSRLDVVHYVPEHTCTVQLTVPATHTNSSDVRFFGKAYYNDEGAETFRNMKAILQSLPCLDGRLTVARPLLYEEELQILWQEGLDGMVLAQYDPESPEFQSGIEAAGKSLAGLHSVRIETTRASSLSSLLKNLDDSTERLRTIRPELADPVELVQSRLVKQADDIRFEPSATLHGDAHLQNYLRIGSGVALIDLDDVRTGDIHEDLGSFAASMYRRALHGPRSFNSEKTTEDFLDAYETAAGGSIDRIALAWHTARSLLTEQARRATTRMKAAGPGTVDLLLSRALHITDCMAGQTA